MRRKMVTADTLLIFPKWNTQPGSYVKMKAVFSARTIVQGDVLMGASRKASPPDGIDEIIRRSQSGDKKAMESLYEAYKTSIFNLAFRYTYNRAIAEDLLHDIFIKVFSHIHELTTEEAFKGWMYRIAVNTCLSHIRSSKSKVKNTVSLEDVGYGLNDRTSLAPENRVMNRPLEQAIKALPSKLKSVFILHDIQGYKHSEVAQMLGWSVGTSKSQLFKARMKIRHSLMNKSHIKRRNS
jgi:RNA polymerase sigma-70 factor (ECF subfamily)